MQKNKLINILKRGLLILTILLLCGCKSCRCPCPIEYYNSIKNEFGETCIIKYSKDGYSDHFLVKDPNNNVWFVDMNYIYEKEGPVVYLYDKILIF
jgi:hypothetical protein